MKERYMPLLLVFMTVIGSSLACAPGTQVSPSSEIEYTPPEQTASAAPTQPEVTAVDEASGIPASVVCREKPGNDLPFRTWRSTEADQSHFVQITGIGPAADDESIWLSTTGGLARLNLKTWHCDLLTQAADVTLAGTSQVILPQEGAGFWIGASQHLLHLSEEGWRTAYQDPDTITAIGLTQAGELCLDTFRHYYRGFSTAKLYFESSQLPLPPPEHLEECQTIDCPLHPSNCDMWQRMSARGQGYNYLTPDECERARQIRAALDTTGEARVEIAFSTDGSAAWGVKNEAPESALLLYQTDDGSHQEALPYTVGRLAPDHVRGGAWLLADDRLVHVDVAADGASPTRFTFHPLAVDFQTPSLDAGPFPGQARGLVIDTADQVWTVNGKSVLRYDEVSQDWQAVTQPAEGADVIAADPKHGVWAAGRGKLVYLDGSGRQSWPMPDKLIGAPTALLVNSDGRVWMGTAEDGVWTVKPSPPAAEGTLEWRIFTAEDGLASTSITALGQAPDGSIYAAHWAGIDAFCPAGGVENGHWVTLPGSDLSERGWVNALTFTPTGVMWAGTHPEGGLRGYDGHWTQDYAPAYGSIGALLVDGEGTLWAGTHHVWSCGKLRHWPDAEAGDESNWQVLDPQNLAVCNVFALAQDSGGRIWIAGPEGVVMWQGER